jgi:hypothetical protein
MRAVGVSNLAAEVDKILSGRPSEAPPEAYGSEPPRSTLDLRGMPESLRYPKPPSDAFGAPPRHASEPPRSSTLRPPEDTPSPSSVRPSAPARDPERASVAPKAPAPEVRKPR